MVLLASVAVLLVCALVYLFNQDSISGGKGGTATDTANAGGAEADAASTADAAEVSGAGAASAAGAGGTAANAGAAGATGVGAGGAGANAGGAAGSGGAGTNAGADGAVSGGRTAQDLDFWDMYPKEEEVIPEELAPIETEEEESDPATDGKHTRVVSPSGEEEWVLINPYLKKNSYELTKFTAKDDLMHYYENGRQASFVGIDLNEYNGEVDFPGLVREGIDFCMLRAGVRGYESGIILQDKAVEENISKAKEAGLRVGLYFSSQAITEDEAREEAAFCLDLARRYEITYPIAYILEETAGGNSRASGLRKDERTANAIAFADAVRAENFVPMLYGDKYFLLKQVDLARLTDMEIWYSDTSDLPDYPYQYSMWQYTQSASVGKLSGLCDLNICFVNYEER